MFDQVYDFRRGQDYNPYRRIKFRKREYDRHRRIRKRYKMGGGYCCGAYLPAITKTWGEIRYAKYSAGLLRKKLGWVKNDNSFRKV